MSLLIVGCFTLLQNICITFYIDFFNKVFFTYYKVYENFEAVSLPIIYILF